MFDCVVIEDQRVDRLHPVTVGRAACTIQCGSWTLLSLLDRVLPGSASRAALVRAYLQGLLEEDHPAWSWSRPSGDRPVVVLNAALVPSQQLLATLASWFALESPLPERLIRDGDGMAAAIISPAAAERWPDTADTTAVLDFLDSLELPSTDEPLGLLRFPHDIVRANQEILFDNLSWRLEHESFREVRDGLFVADGVRLSDELVVDTLHGPIVIDQDVAVGPYTLLSGPLFIGARAKVLEHAAIKEHVSVGHTVKIGGEVEASVIEPYTNKQHHGFLGHAYLGSWINLGAGTCNSDLKNTYGEVKMEYGTTRVATGMQFVGCVMGDYAKSAINTGIFTGKVIGVCSMVYGFVTTNVPSFVNYARLFGQVTELPPEVMVATQRRMFARRGVTPRPVDIRLIHDMYELTRHERVLAGEPLTL